MPFKKLITILLHPETKDAAHPEREISNGKGLVHRKLQLAEIAFPTGKVELALSRNARSQILIRMHLRKQESRAAISFLCIYIFRDIGVFSQSILWFFFNFYCVYFTLYGN